ncbi:MAG TPA: tetratricopeptide repeat protein [Polyangia bacterium]|jgi:hypothetical protein|nr:tetratricopeptide repeat protein [Polyangia bacterium]
MRPLAFVVVLGLFGAQAQVARADDPQRAKELFEQGTRYFDLGQFDKAIDAWQAGYRQKADSRFLYNIAQAYRLAGDANKAIFFYKGYLRNSPRASNRSDVELKIQALQKQPLGEPAQPAAPPPAGTPAEPTPDPGRSRATPPPPPSPSSATTPAGTSGPVTSSVATTTTTPPPPLAYRAGGEPAPGGAGGSREPPPVVASPAPEPGPIETLRPIDLGLAIGVDGWSSGVQGKPDPSFALMLAAGYTFGPDPHAPVRFRLGAHFGYTFLKEANSRETFLSGLVVAGLVIRASPRLGFFGELGLGVVGVSGLKQSSDLLDHTNMLRISGTQSLFEIRPALGLTIRLTPGLGLFASAATDYSPKKANFYQPINRPELLVGVALRI